MAYMIRFGRPLGAVAAAAAGISTAHRFQRQQNVQCLAKTKSTGHEQTRMFQAYTKRYGTNKNVQLSLADVAEILREVGIKNDYIISRLFMGMDDDNSGTVEFKEVIKFCKTLSQGTQSDKAKFLFSACDLNNNGQIEMFEMRKLLKNMMLSCHESLPDYTLVKTEADVNMLADLDIATIAVILGNRMAYELFLAADTDKGGTIDFKEFSFWLNRGGKSQRELVALFPFFEILGQSE